MLHDRPVKSGTPSLELVVPGGSVVQTELFWTFEIFSFGFPVFQRVDFVVPCCLLKVLVNKVHEFQGVKPDSLQNITTYKLQDPKSRFTMRGPVVQSQLRKQTGEAYVFLRYWRLRWSLYPFTCILAQRNNYQERCSGENNPSTYSRTELPILLFVQQPNKGLVAFDLSAFFCFKELFVGLMENRPFPQKLKSKDPTK